MTEEVKTNIQYLDMDGLKLYDSLLKSKIASNIQPEKYDNSKLKEEILKNQTAITVLNGDGEGSVKKQVNDSVAKIVSEAPKAYDKLKEISDWISFPCWGCLINEQPNLYK